MGIRCLSAAIVENTSGSSWGPQPKEDGPGATFSFSITRDADWVLEIATDRYQGLIDVGGTVAHPVPATCAKPARQWD